jgi:hypothetical protein
VAVGVAVAVAVAVKLSPVPLSSPLQAARVIRRAAAPRSTRIRLA